MSPKQCNHNHEDTHPAIYEIEPDIYNATTAATRAPNATTNETVRREALPGVSVADGETVGFETVGVVTEVPLFPLDPVGVEGAPDEAPTIPPPWDGESPPPDETRSPELAAEEADEAALEISDPESVGVALEAGLEVTTVGTAESVAGVGAEEEPEPWCVVGIEEAGVVVSGFGASQERSKLGFRLPSTIPKLGFGVDGSASWRVNHQVLTLSKRGQPTSCQ